MTKDEYIKLKREGNIDERCTCGHLKSEHHFGNLEDGHGSCKYADCACRRFRWAAFIDKRTSKEV